ncbi:hypothetical protein HDV02_001988 [Globomyces sp. JEL0801]|nr:hypothetical protein HDV02_001988 [Globomyces sp. JEL0801]
MAMLDCCENKGKEIFGYLPLIGQCDVLVYLLDHCLEINTSLQRFEWVMVLSNQTSYPVDVARFVEWASTCPSLILLIGDITKQQSSAGRSMKFDYVMLICGFMSAITREPFSTYFSAGALMCFFQVLSTFNQMFVSAMNDPSCSADPVSMNTARLGTLISWFACKIKSYLTPVPCTFFSTRYGLITYSQGEMCYSIADIFAKVFLTLILVNATMESVQNEKVSEISKIANDMEKEIGNCDALLERMMPKEVLDDLKNGKAPGAEEYESVTIFFSDITNFTVISSQTTTKEMLATLNALWKEYDEIAARWNMYKVETIGDAYLGVTGCPRKDPNHAASAVNFSIDIMAMIANFTTAMGSKIQIRIGLNSGPITAGVLGNTNPHWCVVGDTVNTASRMESTSKAMMIHISESTYELIRKSNAFRCSAPEVMDVKGKGKMTTYWVYGRV